LSKKRLNLVDNRNYIAIILSIFIFFIIFLISLTNVLLTFNQKIQAMYFEFSNISVSKNIVIVEIDEQTLSWKKTKDWEIITEWLWRFPFDRKYFAKVVDNLNEDNVWVIGIDIIFWDKSDYSSDKIFSESLKNAWNVILWLSTNPSWEVEFPYSKFAQYILSTWYYRVDIDSSFNVSMFTPFTKFNGSDFVYDHFTIAVLKWFYSYIYDDKKFLDQDIKVSNSNILLNNKIDLLKSRPSVDNNSVLINYVKSERFQKISFLDVYNKNYEPDFFRDKVVLIWTTAKWLKDIFSTPIWREYWVYVHANIINTILTKNSLKYFDLKMEWFLIFWIIMISIFFNISKSSLVLTISNITILWTYVILIVYVTLFTNMFINKPTEFWLAFVLSFALANFVKFIIENKNRSLLNQALSKYVSEHLAKEILLKWNINFKPTKKKIGIFFSDIESFTNMSEKLEPEELVEFLRKYLWKMTKLIMDHRWEIDKFEWDAIMASWWIFLNIDEVDIFNMCKVSLLQQEALKDINLKYKPDNIPDIKVRIWLNYWVAIVWDIWWDKQDYTALWDSVNLASRLEWVNKQYNTYICASESVYTEVKDSFVFRYLDKIRVKWKNNAVNIFELICLRDDLTEEKRGLLSEFAKAIKYYEQRKFKEALVIFNKLDKQGDWPSKTYKYRCEEFIKESPLDDWDWVWVMKTK